MQDFHNEFDHAKRVIAEAAGLVSSQLGKKQIVGQKDSIYQIVTETDLKTEELIRNRLREKFPDHGMIGEEGELLEKEIAWIIDPIDGTVGFEKNLPDCAIVLGLKEGNHMVFSLIYRLFDAALFTAYSGEGAYRDGERIHISQTEKISDAVISLSHRHVWKEQYHTYIRDLTTKTRNFRMGLSSAVDATYIAEGKLDALLKVEQKIWDVAPECLLAKEAGAVVTDGFSQELIYHWNKHDLHSYALLTPVLAQDYAVDFYLRN